MEDIRQRMVVVDSARDLQSLSPYMTRTLRSEVDEHRPTREAAIRIVTFSTEEEAFYNEVYRICLERALAQGVPPGFATQMPERRTASCVPAVASEILRYANEDEDDEHDARFTASEISALEPLARAILRSRDRKIEALIEMLEQAFGELKSDRVMIFSTFRGTLRYLAEKLGGEGLLAGVDVRSYSREGRGLPARREEQGANRNRVQARQIPDPTCQRSRWGRTRLRALPRHH